MRAQQIFLKPQYHVTVLYRFSDNNFNMVICIDDRPTSGQITTDGILLQDFFEYMQRKKRLHMLAPLILVLRLKI